jgi:phosphatidylglycerophosphate synthase
MDRPTPDGPAAFPGRTVAAAVWCGCPSDAWLSLLVTLPVVIAIAAVTGLPPVASVAGSGTLGLMALACFAQTGGDRFGLANGVTLGRLQLAGLAALSPLAAPDAAHWVAAGLAGAALALDGMDGWVARRFGHESAFGARFDMEADTLLLVVVASLVCIFGAAGPWVLAAPVFRPAFMLAGRRWTWIATSLPPSARRKTCCVLSIMLLIAALAPIVPPTAAGMLAASALGCLSLSFALDLAWLARNAPDRAR